MLPTQSGLAFAITMFVVGGLRGWCVAVFSSRMGGAGFPLAWLVEALGRRLCGVLVSLMTLGLQIRVRALSGLCSFVICEVLYVRPVRHLSAAACGGDSVACVRAIPRFGPANGFKTRSIYLINRTSDRLTPGLAKIYGPANFLENGLVVEAYTHSCHIIRARPLLRSSVLEAVLAPQPDKLKLFLAAKKALLQPWTRLLSSQQWWRTSSDYFHARWPGTAGLCGALATYTRYTMWLELLLSFCIFCVGCGNGSTCYLCFLVGWLVGWFSCIGDQPSCASVSDHCKGWLVGWLVGWLWN